MPCVLSNLKNLNQWKPIKRPRGEVRTSATSSASTIGATGSDSGVRGGDRGGKRADARIVGGDDPSLGDEAAADEFSSVVSLKAGSKCTAAPESRGRACPPCAPGFLRMPVGLAI